jgi:hypothetical protein
MVLIFHYLDVGLEDRRLFLSRIVKKIKTRTRAESGNYGNAIAFD